MGRGLGRVERAIAGAFTNDPEWTFATSDLCRIVYGDDVEIEKRHRVSVLRAAKKVCARLHWAA